MPAGRYAPSPTGDLHLGNLRTAVLAWLWARRSGRDFLVRVDDLDPGRSRQHFEQTQLADLAALGVDWDGPIVRQSERTDVYAAALAELTARGLTYECFCTRREIAAAASAPHASDGPPGAYPGTCRDLTEAERVQRRRERPAAIRLRTEVVSWTVTDEVHGEVTGPVDDLVLRRTDGVHAYNLATVVDDAAQGVDQVVRGDDLLSSAPRQAHLAHVLGLPSPTWVHVPLAVNFAGARLAKRDGAVTLRDLPVERAFALIVGSLGLDGAADLAEVAVRFDPALMPREPWVVDPDS